MMDSNHQDADVEKSTAPEHGTTNNEVAREDFEKFGSRDEEIREEIEKPEPYDGEHDATLVKTRSPEASDHHMALAQTKSLEEQVGLPREIVVVGLISLAQLTAQIGVGQTISILHVIGDHYHITNPGTLSWLIAGYSLTVGTFILFSGRLGDLFGWKKMLVIGYSWFAVWSIVAGLAWYSNSVLFIFARILQGIGPSVCLPNALALLGVLYKPGRRKEMAFAIFAACAPCGGVLGTFLGAVSALAWWPCKL